MSVAPGTLIAKKYRTERVIGEGGMGVVLAARHVDLGRRVAIKLVRKDAVVAAGSVERLLREARAAAAIENEHVARVLDVGREKSGEPYLVLEYLEGQDLHARLASGPPAHVADAVSWILQACEGLAAAHARGFVHRDLKPSNLFLARLADGRELVKLLDFGLAKSVAADDGRITATGAILGSPAYMSPEHLSGRALDARSDVWSLGVTLYELLTREVPFPGNTTPEICAAVLASAPVPLASRRHDVPAELVAIVDACLEKDAANRPRDVADLAGRLAPFSDDGAERAMRIARTLASAPREDALPASIAALEAPTHLVSSIDAPPKVRTSPTVVVAAVTACAALIVALVLFSNKKPVSVNATSGLARALGGEPPRKVLMRRAFACAVLVVAARAHADAPRASAVELFAHGRSLAAEGKCTEAIPFFLDTLKLEASVGALLNLAECHEKMHEDALAYARFHEAEMLAHDKSDDREALARTRAAALAERLPKIVIEAPADVRVAVDGHEARTGANVVSEGDHVVRATASGKTAWQTTVHTSGTRAESVVVPALAQIVAPLPPKPRDGAAQRNVGVAVTLAGVVTVAAGGLLGGLAIAKKSDAVALSTGSSRAAFEDARSAAKAFADASTATFVIGGVLAAAGLVVWLSAPHVSASVSATGATLTAAF